MWCVMNWHHIDVYASICIFGELNWLSTSTCILLWYVLRMLCLYFQPFSKP
jgi:hypothetical protein